MNWVINVKSENLVYTVYIGRLQPAIIFNQMLNSEAANNILNCYFSIMITLTCLLDGIVL